MASKLLRPRGFTLVEIMVALGVMSLGALGVMQMAQIQSDVQVKAKSMLGTTQVVNIIQRQLAQEEACNNTFDVAGMSTSTFADGTNIPVIRTVDNRILVQPPSSLYPNDPANPANIPTVTVDRVTVRNDSTQNLGGAAHISFHLEIQITRRAGPGSNNINETRTITLPFPIQIRKDVGANTHDTCVMEGVLATETAAAEMCFGLNGNYNPLNKDCVLNSTLIDSIADPDTATFTLVSMEYFRTRMDAFMAWADGTFALNSPGPTITGSGSIIFNPGASLIKNGGPATNGVDAVTANDITPSISEGIRCSGPNERGFIIGGVIACRAFAPCPIGQYLRGFDNSGNKVCLDLIAGGSIPECGVGSGNSKERLRLTPGGDSITIQCIGGGTGTGSGSGSGSGTTTGPSPTTGPTTTGPGTVTTTTTGSCPGNVCTGGSTCISYCPPTHQCSVYAGNCDVAAPPGDCQAICTTAGNHACYREVPFTGTSYSGAACF